MKRRKPNPRSDKKFFTSTASRVKSINLPVKIFRGGIRL